MRGGGVTLVLGAVAVGLVSGAAWQQAPAPPAQSAPAPAIEWHRVQAAPRRAPDPADLAWEKRAQGNSHVIVASPAQEQEQAVQEGELPRAAGARNDVYVIDGDTFSYGGRRVRILGIDAPETHPPRCVEEARLGLAATAKLKELLGSGTITIGGSGHDQYGRELRQVFVNGQDVGDAMIAAGLARSYDGKKRQGWC